ncbi:hypothetical protein F5Y01DRAFT_269811 [Xylaria sp. FL0043]|nr:hypothetical protein F5Y01DRAFT_269811 [Xylaria sp. FL0043]
MMFVTTLFAASLATSALGWPIFPLPCSSISGTPCSCPFGTDYTESVTTAIIGADAADVGFVANDFFDTAWTGNEPWMVQGPDNVPVFSIRDMNESTAVGDYVFRQRLTFRLEYPDGSFEQRYEQTGNIPYYSGNGSFSGLWVTLKGDRIFQNQTLFRYSSYSCETGHPRNYAMFREMALNNVTTILQAANMIHGFSTIPTSAQSF